MAEEENLIVFEYIKSAYFRVIHSDGLFGGVTPEGNIHFALFSDRPAIPRMQVHKQGPNGSVGDLLPERTVVRPGIIREMDVDVVVNEATARAMVDWLIGQLDQLDRMKIALKGADK